MTLKHGSHLYFETKEAHNYFGKSWELKKKPNKPKDNPFARAGLGL